MPVPLLTRVILKPILRLASYARRCNGGRIVGFVLSFRLVLLAAVIPGWLCSGAMPPELSLRLQDVTDKPGSFRSEVGETGQFTWWLPEGGDEYVLPISAGVDVDSSREDLMRCLRQGSPWSLLELPLLGIRYGDQMLVVIVPWPHYAELIFQDRIGIRFSFPVGRHDATPCGIVAMRRGTNVLEVAQAFREWRRNAADIGVIPRPRTLQQKMTDLETAGRLSGAPHFYLWGPGLFSRHDVPGNQWPPFAKALRDCPAGSFGGKLVKSFTEDERNSLRELASARWAMVSLTVSVAGGINKALSRRDILDLSPDVPASEIIRRNQQAMAHAFEQFVNPPESWGDGLSISLVKSLHDAGIDRALLVLSDLYGRSFRPDVIDYAKKAGFLLGPYDSYHSVHSPDAPPDSTWETAQFDAAAYEQGRVINANGSGHAGFKKRGYHFSPKAAWPYVQERVARILQQAPYSAWFIDCDATGECFDDYSPLHPATEVEDMNLRRQRLAWLESEHRLVVGSEGGSVLFADVIHFGHGVQTPYIGHLDPSFREPKSPHFLGRYWPPDGPDQSFKPATVPPSLKSPYFDPTVRIPLYQAALGDEVIATHHWSFDSLKFKDVMRTRELMEILCMVPPMYHLNRETWPRRRERILQHLAFWGPLHRELATAPLTRFEWLSKDRMLQRTAFQSNRGEVTITVNFGEKAQGGFAPYSATVRGAASASTDAYLAREWSE